MLDVVSMKEIDAIFVVTDALGIHREALVIPLGPASPGRVRKRALVVLFGVWTALTLYAVPLVMGAAAGAMLLVTRRDTLRTLAIPAALIASLLLARAPGWMVALALAQLAVLLVKIAAPLVRARVRSASEVA